MILKGRLHWNGWALSFCAPIDSDEWPCYSLDTYQNGVERGYTGCPIPGNRVINACGDMCPKFLDEIGLSRTPPQSGSRFVESQREVEVRIDESSGMVTEIIKVI
jgi:hypothetical protein